MLSTTKREREMTKFEHTVVINRPVEEGCYEMAEVQEGTRLTMDAVVAGHGFFRIAEPAFARMVRRDGVSSAETLKDVLEAAPVRAS